MPWIGSITLLGLFVGTLGQGEFTDRFGRKTVYQFNLLLFGLATIIGAMPAIPSIGFDPGLTWLLIFRFLAGVGLGAEQPLCFSYTAEYAPKSIRGRTIAFMQFLGGAWPWPVGVLLTLAFRDTIGWRGIWIIIGVARADRLCAALFAAGIAALAGDARPRAARARFVAAHGHSRRRRSTRSPRMRRATRTATRSASSGAIIRAASSPG